MNIKVLLSTTLAILAASIDTHASDVVDAAYTTAALKRDATIWDVRAAEDYAMGHILGAVNIGNVGEVLRNSNTEDLLPTDQLEKLLNGAGIDLSKEIIVYSRMGDPVAHWCLTTVRHLGGKNGKVFHGGMDEWEASHLPVSKESIRLAAVEQKLNIDPTVQVYLDEVVSKVFNSEVQFIDTRTPREFSGDVISALRGGHIPGARNIPYEQNWGDPNASIRLANGDIKTREGMALKSTAQLKSLYVDLDPTRETIVYCQSGVRASETVSVLRILGFEKVRVFEESWLGYGNNLSAPAEAMQFVNIGVLNNRIRSLEAQVKTLADEVKTLKADKQVNNATDAATVIRSTGAKK